LNKIRLGTRGSALALAQAGIVKDRLRAVEPSLEIDIVPIRTAGDRWTGTSFPESGVKGLFVKEIQESLRAGRVDAAVHSLKDLPVLAAEGLRLVAVLEREDPRDCVVSRQGGPLSGLPAGSVVGTASPRRQAQLRAAYPTLRFENIRGNLDTRIQKTREGGYDAVVVARAGLRRLNRDSEISEILPLDVVLPAPGQGCLAVEVRAGDGRMERWAAALNHDASFWTASAERSFLAGLGGGCRVPVAACALLADDGGMTLQGLVISADGRRQVRGTVSGPSASAEELGQSLARKLLADGAAPLLAAVSE